jgi:hypothetical protein
MIKDLNDVNVQCRLPTHFYTKQDLYNIFLDRKIYIWGAGRDGKGVFHALERNGCHVGAFIDRSPVLFFCWGGGGVLIFSKHAGAIARQYGGMGLIEGRDYLMTGLL